MERLNDLLETNLEDIRQREKAKSSSALPQSNCIGVVALNKGPLDRPEWSLKYCMATKPDGIATTPIDSGVPAPQPVSSLITLIPPFEKDDSRSEYSTLTTFETQLTFCAREDEYDRRLWVGVRKFRTSMSALGIMILRHEGKSVPDQLPRYSIFGKKKIEVFKTACIQAGLEWRDSYFTFDVVLRWLNKEWTTNSTTTQSFVNSASSSSSSAAALSSCTSELKAYSSSVPADKRALDASSETRTLPKTTSPSERQALDAVVQHLKNHIQMYEARSNSPSRGILSGNHRSQESKE